jgi:predicted transcriptional regulator of viral defense system
MPGISPKEEEFIAAVGASNLRVFTIADVSGLLGINHIAAAKLAHRLAKKRKIQRIEKSKYILIPPMAWKTGEFTEESIVIASQLISPYYISYWTALSYYGWTEQPSKTIYVAAIKIKRTLEVQGVTFKFVKLHPDKFFGLVDHWVDNAKVTMSDREKTIIDCLDQPRYAGEIVEVAKGLWNGKEEIDFRKLLDYALRMKNGAIIKRLGYLLDILKIDKIDIRKKLLEHVNAGVTTLDPYHGKVKGNINPKWKLAINVDSKNLTEWIIH